MEVETEPEIRVSTASTLSTENSNPPLAQNDRGDASSGMLHTNNNEDEMNHDSASARSSFSSSAAAASDFPHALNKNHKLENRVRTGIQHLMMNQGNFEQEMQQQSMDHKIKLSLKTEEDGKLVSRFYLVSMR